LAERGVEVFGVGKIFDIFLGRGIGESEKTKSNADGMAKTLKAMDAVERGLIFVNLVDFDMLYGHRNDVEGTPGRSKKWMRGCLRSRPRWVGAIWRFSRRITGAIRRRLRPITAASMCRC